MINIISNGSKWAGEQPDTIDDLLKVLRTYPLDRTFERFGNFVEVDRRTKHVTLFGNFLTLSHVFRINADNRQEVRSVIRAIRANQRRPDYLSQSVSA